MQKQKVIFIVLISLAIIFSNCGLFSEPATNIRLPKLFSNNMVLQQNKEIPVWGTATAGGKVIVEIAGQSKSTTVNSAGRWRVNLGALSAGGPHVLTIVGKDSLIFENVMVGEVWLCSGQSNMEWPLYEGAKILNYDQEVAAADYPNIRLFQVDHTMKNLPIRDVNSVGWKECSPENIIGFSAVAYFFGRNLHKNLNIPIGLIQSTWGGTPAEAWTSAASLRENPDFSKIIYAIQRSGESVKDHWDVYRQRLAPWNKEVQEKIDDSGISSRGWESSDFKPVGWSEMQLPTTWEQAGLDVDGIVWFRKEISVPDAWQGQDLTLSLGPINDFDITWFNGKKVGSENHYIIPRRYKIPGQLVNSGRNVIVVLVLDLGNRGGIYGEPKQMKLSSASKDSLSLAGTWQYKVDPIMLDLAKLPKQPSMPNDAHRPTVLFNGMIFPLVPYAMQGAIWYQGESNASRAYQYRTLFKTMIRDWRNHWQQGDFPFLFVQLANFMAIKPEPEDAEWAELREAQLMALSLPNTGMAVAIDIGEAKDIHPRNKQDVGKRLALNARHLVYGENIVHSGPIYKSMTKEGNKIRLSFAHIGGGLISKGGKSLTGFAIAGKNKEFVWAQAKIDGEDVLVWHDDISEPVAIRYAWASNPVCNLYNKAGLPASPFRTDTWKGITEVIN